LSSASCGLPALVEAARPLQRDAFEAQFAGFGEHDRAFDAEQNSSGRLAIQFVVADLSGQMSPPYCANHRKCESPKLGLTAELLPLAGSSAM
jgi:hypothetical protein